MQQSAAEPASRRKVSVTKIKIVQGSLAFDLLAIHSELAERQWRGQIH